MGKGNLIVDWLSGNYTPVTRRGECPQDLKEFIDEVFDGVDRNEINDYHVHLLGLGNNDSKCEVNAEMRTWKNPIKRLSFEAYMSACGISDVFKAEEQFLDQLKVWTQEVGGKFHLLAFDHVHDVNGKSLPNKSEFYVPNEYAWQVCEDFSDYFRPIVSIHPYRKDAIEQLELWAAKGARIVKWLPNAMGITPNSSLCDAFYQKMKSLDMVLLSHAGDEAAVDAADWQMFGNPLLLHKPLDYGVKVIVAHCASLGEGDNFLEDGRKVHNFHLLEKLMNEEKYKGLLYADISALVQFNRIKWLKELLDRPHWHERLVYGSDYPLPAVNIISSTWQMKRMGLITLYEKKMLKKLYKWNPLMYDLAVKLCAKNDKGHQLDRAIFTRKI